jgi:ferritin-like metal-binding protein YciE
MASAASLREHLVEELNDLLNAEQQLIEALPQMAAQASQRELKAAFRSHLAQTKTHEKRVSQALRLLGEEADGETCEAMEGLLEEGQDLMAGGTPGALMDAMMITAAQKVEHYEIAAYGTVRTYAQVLGERKVAQLLEQTLKEEKATDKKLTTIAEGAVNKKASKEYHERATAASTATDMLQKGAQWLGSTVGGAMDTVKNVMPAQASDRGASSQSRGSRRSSNASNGSSSRSNKRSRSHNGQSRGRSRSRNR